MSSHDVVVESAMNNVRMVARWGQLSGLQQQKAFRLLFCFVGICDLSTVSAFCVVQKNAHGRVPVAKPPSHHAPLFARLASSNDSSEPSPLLEKDEDDDDELWSMAMDDMMLDGPDAFLNDDDLSLLHDIELPPSSTKSTEVQSRGRKTTDNILQMDSSSSPQIISLQDMKKLSSGLSYFFLRDELGFSEDAMWKITNEAGSVLGMTVTNINEKVQLLRSTMGLSDEDLRTLVTAQPSLLQLSAKQNLAPTMRLLIRQLNIKSREHLRKLVMGCPALLAYSLTNLRHKIHFFQDTMGYSVDDSRALLLEEPKLMTASVETGLMPRFRFLHQEVEISVEDLRKMVTKNPRMLLMSVDHNLQPKLIFYFIMTLYLRPVEVQKLLMSYPRILDYNLDRHILPITRYILSLDVSPQELGRMVLKFPRLFTYSLPKIKHVVGYLRFELGLEATDVRRILYQAPQLVSLTTDTLQGKVDFLLQAAAPGATRGESTASTDILRKLIVGMPTLLYLSLENNLGPKVEYLQEQLGVEELTYAIARLPTLLAYSLDKRIKPRLEKIVKAGVDGGSITVGIPMKEEAFDQWLENRARKAKLGLDKKGRTTTKKAKRKVLPEIDASEVPQDETNDKGRNKRVVQEGGRIVHWVRKT
jgi:mTERF domain-containing protein